MENLSRIFAFFIIFLFLLICIYFICKNSSSQFKNNISKKNKKGVKRTNFGMKNQKKIYDDVKECDFVNLHEVLQINDYNLPKIVWTYWDDRNPPCIVKESLTQIRKVYSDYIVYTLNEENVRNFVPDKILDLKFAKTHPKRSDFIRLFLLRYYGGIWIDSSFKLDKKLPIDLKKDVTIYRTPHHFNAKFPILENWYISAKKGSPFIAAWFKEFMRVNEFNEIKDYVDDLKKKGTSVEFDTEYLTMHLSGYHILKSNPKYLSTITTMSSTEQGAPFSLHSQIDFKDEKFKKFYMKNKDSFPYIKIRGIDRKNLSI